MESFANFWSRRGSARLSACAVLLLGTFAAAALCEAKVVALVHFATHEYLDNPNRVRQLNLLKFGRLQEALQRELPRMSIEIRQFQFVQGINEKTHIVQRLDELVAINNSVRASNKQLIDDIRKAAPGVVYVVGAAAARLIKKHLPNQALVFECICNPIVQSSTNEDMNCENNLSEQVAANYLGPHYTMDEVIELGLDAPWNLVVDPRLPDKVTGVANYGLQVRATDSGQQLISNQTEGRLQVLRSLMVSEPKVASFAQPVIGVVFGTPYNNRRWCYREKLQALGFRYVDIHLKASTAHLVNSLLEAAGAQGALFLSDGLLEGDTFDILANAVALGSVPVVFPRKRRGVVNKSPFGGWATVLPDMDNEIEGFGYLIKALKGTPISALPVRFPNKMRVDYNEQLIRAKRPEALPILQRMPNAHPF